jgi:hypothetical protein
MNTEALFLFLILLLGLVLCSFLGGNCGKEGLTGNITFNLSGNGQQNRAGSTVSDSGSTVAGSGSSTSSSNQYDNYNHYTGSSTQLSSGSVYYGPQGTTAKVTANGDGSQSLQITLPGSSTPVTFTSGQPTTDASSSTIEKYTNYYGMGGTVTTFYGPNGATATVVNTNNGQKAIKVTTSSGTYYYNVSGNENNYTDTSTQYYGSTGYSTQTYDGAYGGSAGSVTGPQGNTAYYAQGPYGNTVAGTTNDGYSSNQYYGPYGGSAGSVTGPQGNSAYYAQGPAGNTVAGTTSSDYSSTLPQGIPASQIPSGQEDLYILKSQVVPPVCPACPSSSTIPRQEPCPACPPCARCPEPSFECKKVPNYSAINNEYLPAPVLNDFSQFGM